MIFTQNQIQAILEIIDKNVLFYIGTTVSVDTFSSVDKMLLKSYGIDVEKMREDFPQFLQAYHWGRLSQALGHLNATKVSFNDFMKYLTKGQYNPMTRQEQEMLRLSEMRTYTHLKGLGETMKQTVNGIILEEDAKLRAYREAIIGKEISAGIRERSALSDIVSEIGKKTGDWQRNLGRIVDYEYNTIFNQGRAEQIISMYGEDAEVYKDVFSGACRHCIAAYLTNGIGSQPIVYKLSQLIANGTNIGRKVQDWLPVIGSHHPFCRCMLNRKDPNTVWDDEKNRFVLKQLEEKDVFWTKKDKITVGDKIFYV